ncbi:MAG: ATPase domain-containing protein [Nitrososphaerales archaeon]
MAQSQVLSKQAPKQRGAPGESQNRTDTASAQLLLDSLLSSKVRYVLIKGEPGSGKTTLALELMKNYGGGVYISTRVSQQLSMEQQPTIGELLQQEKIKELNLEAGSTRGSPPTSSDSGSFRFEDYRLNTAPDVLAAVLEAMDKIRVEPLIVLDSWDSIAKRIEPVERQKTEQAMLVMAEVRGARVLFVSEEPALTTIDYVVDAVIQLSDELLEGRRIRRIAWKKLRGNAIPQRSYLYTLHGGRFTIFENTKVLPHGSYQIKPFVPIKHKETLFSTGSADLDSFLGGGIPRGSFVVLELGRHVNPVWHVPILQSIQSNFLANDGCVLVIPTTHATPMSSKAKLARYFAEDLLNERLRIGHYQSYPADPCFVKLESNSTTASNAEAIRSHVSSIKGKENRSCAYFMGIDTIESFVPPEVLKPLANGFSSSMKVSGDMMVAVVKPGSLFLEQLSESCDIHLKIEEFDRTMVLYSLNPPSEFYNVYFDYGHGYPGVKLSPIL